MENQEQSHLLSVPLELRQAIYACIIPNAVHVFLRKGRIAISMCIEPDIAGDLCGNERKPSRGELRETIWARRLRSSWGPHWQCEEIAQRTAGYRSQASCDFDPRETTVAFLFVCTRMYVV